MVLGKRGRVARVVGKDFAVRVVGAARQHRDLVPARPQLGDDLVDAEDPGQKYWLTTRTLTASL